MEKLCIVCEQPNSRLRSNFCSRSCDKLHRYQLCVINSICVKCHSSTNKNNKICQKCLDRQKSKYDSSKKSTYCRLRRQKAKEKKICIVCCARNAEPKKVSCQKCLDTHNSYIIKSGENIDVLAKRMLMGARRRAKKYNLPFNIDISDIKIPENCPILDIELKKGKGSLSPNSPTLDKIIPEKGYVKGNVKVISHKANFLKSNMSLNVLLKIATYVKENSNDL